MRQLLAAWALDAAAFARVLAADDPAWGSETFAFAGGHAVLCGPGLYVNRALAAGLDHPLTGADLALLEERSAAVGVPAAIEISPATHADVGPRLRDRGYRAEGEVTALRCPLVDLDSDLAPDTSLSIDRADGDLLPLWQETSASGWGHTTPAARRASDAFARAAAVVDGERLVLARRVADGHPVGCASLTVRNRIATLGGMSTVPTARRQGVQSSLIRHRLRVARSTQDASSPTSTTVRGSDSERNLIRHGFQPWFTITTMSEPHRPR